MEIVLRLGNGDPRLQTSGSEEPVTNVIRACRIQTERQPQHRRCGMPEVGRQQEAGRHDADDFVRPPVDLNGASDDRRIAAVSPLPQARAENHDVGSVPAILGIREHAAEDWRDAERCERVRRDFPSGDALRLPVAGQVDVRRVPRRNPGHRPVLAAVVVDLAFGDPCLVFSDPPAPNHDRVVGIGPRQRPQQDGVDDREHDGVAANAKRQRRNGNRREERISAQRPGGVVDIATQVVEPDERSRVAVNVLCLLDAAECAPGCRARVVHGHSAPHELVFEECQVGSHFAREIGLGAAGTNDVHEPQAESSQCAHIKPRSAAAFRRGRRGGASVPFPCPTRGRPLW